MNGTNNKNRKYRQGIFAFITTTLLVSGAFYHTPSSPRALAEAKLLPAQEMADTPVAGHEQLPPAPSRDPFAIPTELLAPTSSVPATIDHGTTTTPKENPPVLAGVVIGKNSRSAIIQSGGDSRSYRLGDYVGSSQITAINQNSVTLEGPKGSQTIGLRR